MAPDYYDVSGDYITSTFYASVDGNYRFYLEGFDDPTTGRHNGILTSPDPDYPYDWTRQNKYFAIIRERNQVRTLLGFTSKDISNNLWNPLVVNATLQTGDIVFVVLLFNEICPDRIYAGYVPDIDFYDSNSGTGKLLNANFKGVLLV